jgi:hypothetical protein
MTKSYFEKNEQKMCDQRKGNKMQTSIYYQSEISPTSEHYLGGGDIFSIVAM